MAQFAANPGLEGVVASETAVSSLADGLSYRGYPIEELLPHASFEEVAYLILYGELPSSSEMRDFNERVRGGASLPESAIRVCREIPPQVQLMDVMRSGVSLLAHWDPDQTDNSHSVNLRKAERLLAQLPTILAARHRMVEQQEPIAPNAGCSLAENLLRMLGRSQPARTEIRALDMSMMAYAEMELTASTFAARVVASTLSDLHSAVTAAIGALKGPLHGGANQRVLELLKQASDSNNPESWIRDALARKQRIMGFGHRVYKQGDPRAKLLKPLCEELATKTGHAGMETLAAAIERVVVQETGLLANVDWPTARLYHYLNLPPEIYTPLFAVSRVAGWCAHVIEQLDNNRLIRPIARYVGKQKRSWKPMEER
jgi:citrate synthase